MFALEALQAKHGDCLLLLAGEGGDPGTMVLIDGGPADTWAEVLKPRLGKPKPGEAIRLPLVVVSHIDDDHIAGILDLTDAMESDLGKRPPKYRIDRLWHNAIDELIGLAPPSGGTAGVLASIGASSTPDHESARERVLASFRQGERLRAAARKLGIPVNEGDGMSEPVEPILAGAETTVGGVDLQVLAPSRKRLETLREKWRKDLDKRKSKGTPGAESEAATAAYSDQSPYNLSSIVVLARKDGKTMLLTGDARGDDVLEGLRSANLLDEKDTIHVDLLKLPHHGSRNTVAVGFFRQVTADHYVVSGDRGKFPNPHRETLEMLLAARPPAEHDYTVWLTYDLPGVPAMFPEGRCKVPAPGEAGVRINLE
ncbi:ComEC/Rec2 family competence protein [Azospirillum soli]|uniref:ComEC/Rec2 family competence protein n=1 Tax=Azospirillum soli TaxID=1304799 RepID=UPI001AEAA59B|nr:hypothetical protein [Azospirillum soli]MBP2315328.1 beta-lactamase superfamily II metal-dependent hydrolase [Azospirillum soli]